MVFSYLVINYVENKASLVWVTFSNELFVLVGEILSRTHASVTACAIDL